MKYELLLQLLPMLSEFEKNAKNEISLADFANWLQQKTNETPNEDVIIHKEISSIPPQGDANAQISQFLSLMYKYLKFYLKKTFEGTPLVSADDFGFLASLFMFGDMTKNELIHKNTCEFTSGMEIIKRLEKSALIHSYPNPEDARARCVGITDAGKYLFFNMLPKLQVVGNIATATLDDAEKATLLQILNKLNHFHNPIFHQAKADNIQEISDKFLKKE